MLSPLLRCLSTISSLLRLSPPPLSGDILTPVMVVKLISTIATSLVPYKSPCWSPVSFTPDVMQSEIRTPIALGHRYKRNYLFLTSSLLAYEASVADSLYSALQQTSSEIKSPFFLIVHHNVCFHCCSIRWFAGYLWQSPAEVHSSSSDQFIGQFCSLDFHMNADPPKSLPSFVQHLHSYNWMKFKTHTFMYVTLLVFERLNCPTKQDVIWKLNYKLKLSPAMAHTFCCALGRLNLFPLSVLSPCVESEYCQ